MYTPYLVVMSILRKADRNTQFMSKSNSKKDKNTIFTQKHA